MAVRSTAIAGGALARSGVGAPEDKSLEGIVGSEKPEGEYAMLAKVPPVACKLRLITCRASGLCEIHCNGCCKGC